MFKLKTAVCMTILGRSKYHASNVTNWLRLLYWNEHEKLLGSFAFVFPKYFITLIMVRDGARQHEQ